MLGWAPERSDKDQLRRERNAETAALLGRWSLGCLTAAAALGLDVGDSAEVIVAGKKRPGFLAATLAAEKAA